MSEVPLSGEEQLHAQEAVSRLLARPDITAAREAILQAVPK